MPETSMIEPKKSPSKELEGKTVLIVDDEELIVTTLAYALNAYGAQVILAENGESAVPLLNRALDLVVSDVQMTGMDGVALLKVHRELPGPRPPFVFFTATSRFSRQEALQLGAAELIRKPIRIQQLLTLFANLLGETEVVQCG